MIVVPVGQVTEYSRATRFSAAGGVQVVQLRRVDERGSALAVRVYRTLGVAYATEVARPIRTQTSDTVLRWRLVDVETDEEWTMPINPNTMTDPEARQRVFNHSVRSVGGFSRSFETAAAPVEWEFGGVIYTKVHHDALEHWARKDAIVEIYDHLGRSFRCVMKTFEPTERRPTPSKPWRFTYAMHALILRRVQ